MKHELDGLSDHLKQAILKSRHRIIESVGKNMDLYGVTHSVGHLYGLMYFSDGPVTLDDMREEMGMSKTSMSTGMRTLMDLKMVNKVWGKGCRKDLYETEFDWHQNFVDYFSIKWRKSMESNTHQLCKSLSELEVLLEQYQNDEKARDILLRDIDKIKHALSYYRWLDQLIRSMETGEIFTFIPKEIPPFENG